MATIDQLNVLLTADSSKFESVMGRATGTAEKFGKSAGKSQAATSAIFSGLRSAAGALGVGIGLEAVRRSTLDTLKSVEANETLANKIGMSYNSLATLHYAAETSASSIEAVDSALLKMSNTIGQAAFGEQASIKSLARLGLSYDRLKSLKPEDQFVSIMQAVNGLASPLERTAALQDIFGRGAAELGGLINMTAEDLRNFASEAERAGLTLSRSQLDKLRSANDALDRLGQSWSGFKNQMVADVAPGIASSLEMMTRGFNKAGEAQMGFFESWGQAMAIASDWITGDLGKSAWYSNTPPPKPLGTEDFLDKNWSTKWRQMQAEKNYNPPAAISAGSHEDAIFSAQKKFGQQKGNPQHQQVSLLKQANALLSRIERGIAHGPVEYSV